MKMISLINKFIVFFFISVFFSCGDRKVGGVYRVLGDPMYTVTLVDDSTYIDYYDMSRGYGHWKLRSDTIILNSKWKDCCIDSVLVHKSATNKNENCLVFFKLFDDSSPQFTCPILFNNVDSLNVTVFSNDTLILTKNSNYKYIQIRVPVGYNKLAIAPVMKFEYADTVTFKYDYMYSTKGYGFTINQKFILRKKNRTLVPIHVKND